MFIIDSNTGEVVASFDPTSLVQTFAIAALVLEKYSDLRYILYSSTGASGYARTFAESFFLN